MIKIYKSVYDFYYNNERIGGKIILTSRGHTIEGYDTDKYTPEEALKAYLEKNNIEDEFEIDEC